MEAALPAAGPPAEERQVDIEIISHGMFQGTLFFFYNNKWRAASAAHTQKDLLAGMKRKGKKTVFIWLL